MHLIKRSRMLHCIEWKKSHFAPHKGLFNLPFRDILIGVWRTPFWSRYYLSHLWSYPPTTQRRQQQQQQQQAALVQTAKRRRRRRRHSRVIYKVHIWRNLYETNRTTLWIDRNLCVFDICWMLISRAAPAFRVPERESLIDRIRIFRVSFTPAGGSVHDAKWFHRSCLNFNDLNKERD